jgi:hypothetical protein
MFYYYSVMMRPTDQRTTIVEKMYAIPFACTILHHMEEQWIRSGNMGN